MIYSNLNSNPFVKASEHEDKDPKAYTRKEGFLKIPLPRLEVHDQDIPINSIFNNAILHDPLTGKFYGIKDGTYSEEDREWNLRMFREFDLREVDWGQHNDSFYEAPLQIDQERTTGAAATPAPRS